MPISRAAITFQAADHAVNDFIEGETSEVLNLSYHSNSFSYVVFLEYEPR